MQALFSLYLVLYALLNLPIRPRPSSSLHETKVRFVHCHDISEETFSREGGNEVSNTMDWTYEGSIPHNSV
jgi:hypothetical protein